MMRGWESLSWGWVWFLKRMWRSSQTSSAEAWSWETHNLILYYPHVILFPATHILPTFNIYSNLHSWTINNTASLFLLPSKWLQLALSWLFPELVTKKFLRSRDLISAFSDKHKSEWIKDAALHSLVRLPPLRNVISLEISSLIHYLLTNTVMYYSPQIRWKITGSDFPAQFIGLLYILLIFQLLVPMRVIKGPWCLNVLHVRLSLSSSNSHIMHYLILD